MHLQELSKKEENHYIKIMQEQVFYNTKYDYNHLEWQEEEFKHFILYNSNKIVSIALVEFIPKSVVAVRFIATDKKYRRQGYATALIKLLEDWVKLKGKKIIKVYALTDSKELYLKLGYTEYLNIEEVKELDDRWLALTDDGMEHLGKRM